MPRLFARLVPTAALGLALIALGLAACSDGGGSGPTAPPPPAPAAAGSASLSGQVTGVGGASASPASAASAIGVTVRIRGTDLATTTDAQGRFGLGGVPAGNQVVLFETSSASAPLEIPAIQAGERIELTVALQGSTVQVQSMNRSGGGGGGEPALTLEMQPDVWNTNWTRSSGTVSAFIRGDGFDRIDLDSIVLLGSDPDAEPLAPTRVDRAGNHVRAFFRQSAAFATLDDPQPNDVHTVTLELTVEGEPFSLTDDVRIVGPGTPPPAPPPPPGPGPVALTADMQPDAWNTNWTRSSGTVSAFIRGSGFDRIDLDSIVLIGTDPGADPLAPSRVDRQGNHIRAFFAKPAAIGILDTPRPGEVHMLTIELTVEGELVTLTTQVRVVGPPG